MLDFWAASACALAPAAGGFGGVAPWPPKFPVRKRLLVMRASAWYRVRNGFAGNAHANPARKLQPRSGEEFRRPLARIAAEGRASATAEGDSKGGTPLDCSFAYFSAGAEK